MNFEQKGSCDQKMLLLNYLKSLYNFISTLDRNDNDPIMSQRNYDIVVSESEPLGSEILKVVATDPDEDSEIRYEIVGGNVANAFSISSRQGIGIITIAQPLDYNKEKFYR